MVGQPGGGRGEVFGEPVALDAVRGALAAAGGVVDEEPAGAREVGVQRDAHEPTLALGGHGDGHQGRRVEPALAHAPHATRPLGHQHRPVGQERDPPRHAEPRDHGLDVDRHAARRPITVGHVDAAVGPLGGAHGRRARPTRREETRPEERRAVHPPEMRPALGGYFGRGRESFESGFERFPARTSRTAITRARAALRASSRIFSSRSSASWLVA